jgi:hypothetical protein
MSRYSDMAREMERIAFGDAIGVGVTGPNAQASIPAGDPYWNYPSGDVETPAGTIISAADIAAASASAADSISIGGVTLNKTDLLVIGAIAAGLFFLTMGKHR